MKKIAVLREMIEAHKNEIKRLQEKADSVDCDIIRSLYEHSIELKRKNIKEFQRMIGWLQAKESIVAKF